MRTIEQITADMEATQSQLPELAALNSTSDVSFFALLKSMWVLLVSTLEQRWDEVSTALTAQQKAGQLGSLTWYVNQVKAFQYGDQVTVYDGVRVGYETVDASKQIVKQANISEQPDGRLLLKVAKPSGLSNGPLTENELTALKDYVREVKYAGVAIDVVSLEPDQFRIDAVVKYDRQIMTATGHLLSEPGRMLVPESLIIFIRSLPFDSGLRLTDLANAVLATPGVIDFQIRKAYSRPTGGTAWIEIDREVISRAGHMNLDLTDCLLTYV